MHDSGIVEAGRIARESTAEILVGAFLGSPKLIHIVRVGALQTDEIAITEQAHVAFFDVSYRFGRFKTGLTKQSGIFPSPLSLGFADAKRVNQQVDVRRTAIAFHVKDGAIGCREFLDKITLPPIDVFAFGLEAGGKSLEPRL